MLHECFLLVLGLVSLCVAFALLVRLVLVVNLGLLCYGLCDLLFWQARVSPCCLVRWRLLPFTFVSLGGVLCDPAYWWVWCLFLGCLTFLGLGVSFGGVLGAVGGGSWLNVGCLNGATLGLWCGLDWFGLW